MNQNEFVKGKRLIDPVTGRVEGDSEEVGSSDEKSNESFEDIEKSSIQSKRARISDIQMNYEEPNSQMSY